MGEGPSGEDRSTGSTDKATVLVVEDEDSVAELYTTILSRDYEVKRASTGGEALAEFDDEVDVVLLDRRMPGMSGDDVLEQLESREADCRVAMVSAVEPDFDVVDMGFDDYLVKPVENENLLGTVERLLALDEYESYYQELSSKKVKKNILEVEKERTILEDSEQYQQLIDRIETLEEKLDDIESEREFDERLLPS